MWKLARPGDWCRQGYCGGSAGTRLYRGSKRTAGWNWRGQIVVTPDAGQSQTVPITMVISGQAQSLLLSQTALDFQVAPGSPPVTQTFGIVNTGTGSMNWSIPSSETGWRKDNPSERSRCRRSAYRFVGERNSRPAGVGLALILRNRRGRRSGRGKWSEISNRFAGGVRSGKIPCARCYAIRADSGWTDRAKRDAGESQQCGTELFIDRGDRGRAALAHGRSGWRQCPGEWHGSDQRSGECGWTQSGVVARDYDDRFFRRKRWPKWPWF